MNQSKKYFRYTSDLNNHIDFENDIESFDASIMNFIALGECISKISDKFRSDNPNINWNKIYAFRNILAHDYFGILPEEVWQIIKKHLPILKADLENIIST